MCFNPRTHVGCDLRAMRQELGSKAFQSTHPRGVRRYVFAEVRTFWSFQSTHPRGVRRILNLQPKRTKVSIHAPTWGATIKVSDIPHRAKVSIHAPTWGATSYDHVDCGCKEFQSTHPRGVRPFRWSRPSPPYTRFNPRTHVGCDNQVCSSGRICTCFNPRTHVGCDTTRDKVTRIIKSFNPRTHVGCDMYQFH